MTVRIGHASIGGNGKATGDVAGDQTGKEVCIRSWYNKGWTVLLRAKDPAVRKKIASSCIAACENDNIGYDQSGRNTALQEAQKADWDFSEIDTPSETDCSALASACVQAAGVDVWDGGNAPTTRTMEKVLTATGAFEALTDSKYLTSSDHLLEGDILLKPGSHVVMVLDDGAKAGEEVHTQQDIVTVYYSVQLPQLVRGMKSDAVKAMQQLLLAKGYELPRYGADGDYGGETENALLLFQEDMNLTPDARCGPDAWSALLGLTGAG